MKINKYIALLEHGVYATGHDFTNFNTNGELTLLYLKGDYFAGITTLIYVLTTIFCQALHSLLATPN